MTWTCPDCGKEFRNTNQWHSCYVVSVEEHLRNKPPEIRATYEKLMKEVNKFGKVTLNPVKSAIQVKSGATFMSVKPMKNKIEIEFQHSEEINRFPVYKQFRLSKNRVVNCMVIEKQGDVNKKLLTWLKTAYELVSD